MMEAHAGTADRAAEYPVTVSVQPALEGRDRLTAFFRFFLAIPHLLLVGGPVGLIGSASLGTENGADLGFGTGGVLGLAAWVVAVIAWFFIVLTARHPDGLWKLPAFYLRWRVRAVAYLMLLRDEYPPFGDGDYPAELVLPQPRGDRDRLTVAFRLLLIIPHIIVLWFLNVAWAFTTAVGWVVILFTGRYPETLYGFAIGVLAWSTRVEAYLLLLRDEYPPFTLRA